MNYIPRISDKNLQKYLKSFGAILIEGPKWCGKTSSGKQYSESVFDIADPSNNFQNRTLAETSIESILPGSSPRLIDEWQEVPQVWDAVKHDVDAKGKKGMYILTGSSTPRDDSTIHSGAGRIGRIKMSTMTLSELGISNGSASIGALLGSKASFKTAGSTLTLNDILSILCKGGWPELIKTNLDTSRTVVSEYINTITNEDVSRIDKVSRDPSKMRKLLQSLARNTASLVSKETLRKDIDSGDNIISPNTLEDYLNVLRRIFIVEEIPAWYPALKSTVRLRTAPKRILSDPSLAVAALKASPASLMNDLKLTGNIFENLVLHDLLVYAQANNAKIFHYNDNTDLEIDAIIEGDDMKWGAFEIKLSQAKEEEGASSLKQLATKFDLEKQKKPEFLAVITGIGGILHQRADGVWVIPIEFLGA